MARPKKLELPVWCEYVLFLLTIDAGVFVPPVYVWGPPSTGKTWLCQNTSERATVIVTLHKGQPIEELRGMYVPSTNASGNTLFEWRDGPVVTAMRNGWLLVVNEIGEASDDVISLLYAVLDRPESSAYTLPTGETIKPAKGFRVVATGNANPDTLPEAIQSRFAIQIHAEKPNPNAVNMLPNKYRAPALATMEQDKGERIDPRRWAAFNDLLPLTRDRTKAVQIVFGDKAEEIERALSIMETAAETKQAPEAE